MTSLKSRGVSTAEPEKKDDDLSLIAEGSENSKKIGGKGKSFYNFSLLKGIFIGASVTAVLFKVNHKPNLLLPPPQHMEILSNTNSKNDENQTSLAWHEKSRPILAEFPPIGRRLEFLSHLEKLPSFKTAIEVGVQRGVLAKKSLDIWKSCTEYKLVDLWGKEEGYNEPGTDTAADKDANLRQTRSRMKPWVAPQMNPPKVEFFVMRSTDASKHLADHYFDYVYLDARHDYCAVKEDIMHYWPKLRPGGIVGGHDYIDAQYAIDKLGPHEDWSKCEDGSIHPEAVKGAVDEFRMQEGNLEVYTSDEDFPSWYLQKPY